MMKQAITYDDLRKKAIETRAELFEKGYLRRTSRRVRKKPRPSEELNVLFERAIERVTRYKPYYDRDGKLVLPYFLQ
ncbi:MAG TPA: hypothetical protein VLK23_14635 [Thermodesulfobacteriota bacterium]|nr:hypothetical protein [Thermodesulfobacteriota bacterium]